MTSFQRLLKGLQTLNRYSGITEGRANEIEWDHVVEVPIPVSINLDPKDSAALTKLGWTKRDDSWTFHS